MDQDNFPWFKSVLQQAILMFVVLILPVSKALSAEPYKIESRIFSLARTMPQLNREKQIWIYLPPGYGLDEHKRFPVVYMQDGQYLFDSLVNASDSLYMNEALARKLRQGRRWYGSWQIDKHLDRLVTEKKTGGIIVVGISSGDSNRTAEYSPWPWRDAPVPEGEQYVEFVVQSLKPYIDKHYLTLSGREDTGIAGSSIGGLLALYAGLKYQNVFSKIAAFSPVLTPNVFGQHLLEHISREGKSHAMRIYVDLGTAELNFGPLKPVYEALRAAGFFDEELRFRLIPKGEHRIEHWGKRLPEVLLWLFSP